MYHSLHGSYIVNNQRYIKEDGSRSSFLKEQGGAFEGRYSRGLDELLCMWITKLSYQDGLKFLEFITGTTLLTSNGLQDYIIRRGVEISEDWKRSSLSVELGQLLIADEIDVYDSETQEIIVMMDDVCVKAQKPHKKVDRVEEDAKRIDTTIALIRDNLGAYHPVTEGINLKGEIIYPIEDAIQDKVLELHCVDYPLPIVALTDGARSIRLSLEKIFGIGVCIILDWYHLSLKITTLMSMIACNKEDKTLYIHDLKAYLWKGKVDDALTYLIAIPRIKHAQKHQELLGYLSKHKSEIIDYEKRQKAGKTIGSGRCEKANDCFVAHRQKKKGMAWAANGSKALAILRVHFNVKAA